jgi:hypothetical protein
LKILMSEEYYPRGSPGLNQFLHNGISNHAVISLGQIEENPNSNIFVLFCIWFADLFKLSRDVPRPNRGSPEMFAQERIQDVQNFLLLAFGRGFLIMNSP